jgi:hypothetical protein
MAVADRTGHGTNPTLLETKLHPLGAVQIADVVKLGDSEAGFGLHYHDRAVAHLDLSYAGAGRGNRVSNINQRALAGGSLAPGGQDDLHIPHDELENPRRGGDGLPSAHCRQHQEQRKATRQDREIARKASFFSHPLLGHWILRNPPPMDARIMPKMASERAIRRSALSENALSTYGNS